MKVEDVMAIFKEGASADFVTGFIGGFINHDKSYGQILAAAAVTAAAADRLDRSKADANKTIRATTASQCRTAQAEVDRMVRNGYQLVSHDIINNYTQVWRLKR